MKLDKKDKNKLYFYDFEISNIEEPYAYTLPLFKTSTTTSSVQQEQLKTFKTLEKNAPFVNAASFKNQVHFQNAYQTPVQRWFPYREGYSTRLVDTFIKELKVTGNIFDPFSGSGTTLIAARHNNLNSFGIDVNPISVLVSKVENERYNKIDKDNFKDEIKKIKSTFRSKELFKTPFELASKVFNSEILQSLLQLKVHIKNIDSEKIQNIFFVAWLAIIEDVSNIKKEGNGIKYKNRKRTSNGYINIDKEVWENQVFPEDKFGFVKAKLINHLNKIFEDINSSYGPCNKQPQIFNGSCLEFDNYFSDEVELTFYSPPYCNSFDYFEIHKVDLWLGGFISTRKEFRQLRNTGFRSNTNALNNKLIIYKNEHIENLISLFDNKRLWNKRIPSVVRGYFDDTYTLLSKLYQQTTKGGSVGIVVGNSAYSGVIIPTDILTADIAREVGFKVKNIFITRHLTTSSQQKKELEVLKNHLRESIILLEK